MRRRHGIAGAAAIAAAIAGRPSARAQEAPAAPAGETQQTEAEILFEQGKALLAKDDWTAACALFDASAKLAEAAPALVKVARCRAREGHLAGAIEIYERALAQRPWAELDRLVRAELFEVERRTPSIRVTLLEPAAGVSLRRNGRTLPPDALRAPLWTDVGAEEHFLAEAAGFHAASFDLTARAEGEVLELRIALARDEPAKVPPPPPADARRPAGWAMAGAGALALGIGAGFGVDFLSQRSSLFDGCTATLADGRHVCPASTSARYDDAVAARARSAALLGAGAALAIGGVLLLATAPRRASDAPRLSLAARPGGIALGCAF